MRLLSASKRPTKVETINFFIHGYAQDHADDLAESQFVASVRSLNLPGESIAVLWPSGHWRFPATKTLFQKFFRKAATQGPIRGLLATITSLVEEEEQVEARIELYQNFCVHDRHAERVGIQLASAIRSIMQDRPHLRVNILGHSLGTRVIYHALLALSGSPIIEACFLLGGVADLKCAWERCATVVRGAVYNLYSTSDLIVAMLEGVDKVPRIGSSPLSIEGRLVKNYDCKCSHFAYWDCLKQIAECAEPQNDEESA